MVSTTKPSNIFSFDDTQKTTLRHVGALFFALVITGILMRGYLWWPVKFTWFKTQLVINRAFHNSYYDIILLLAIAAIAAFIGLSLAKWEMGQKIYRAILTIMAILYAAILAMNSIAVEWLNVPLTYQWLYYADLARSYTPQTAIASTFTLNSGFMFLGSMIAFVLSYFVARMYFTATIIRSLSIALVIYIAAVSFNLPERDAIRDAISNPVKELVASAWASRNNTLLTAQTDAIDRSYHINQTVRQNAAFLNSGTKRNVVMIVLESVSAHAIYDRPLGNDPDLPNIAKLRERGISFSNYHAPAAQSTRAIFTMLTGRYPRLSYQPETYTLADEKFISVAERFKSDGYTTSFFMGAEFAFQGVDDFIADKGFDELIDIENLGCENNRKLKNKKFKNISNVPTSCVVDAFNTWNDGKRDTPYFSILWFNDTHFPYYPEDTSLTDNAEKYRAAVKDADTQIGRVLNDLETDGELDNTIIIITGDHGEAFGEHNNVIHGSTLYQEEMRIPLIISNADLLKESGLAGQDSAILSSQTDLAPLLLDIIGAAPEPSWQGISPLSDTRINDSDFKIYLMSTRRGNSAGLIRTDGIKYMYDQRRAEMTKFDLKSDPGERKPLSVGKNEKQEVIGQIAAWVQYNDALYKD